MTDKILNEDGSGDAILTEDGNTIVQEGTSTNTTVYDFINITFTPKIGAVTYSE